MPTQHTITTFGHIPDTGYNHLFKFQIKGDAGVGKSSLLKMFSDNTFPENYSSTIGVDFKIRSLMIEDSRITAQIWDCAGQERFRVLQNTIQGVDALILVFNLTDLSSLHATTALLNEHCENNLHSNVVLVGTQSDRGNERVMQVADIEAFMERSRYPIEAYIETSAKTGENVQAVFETAARLVLHRVVPCVQKQPFEEDERLEENDNSPKMQLISDLKKYITRIQSHPSAQNKSKPNFSYGFWFFKDSRAINRKANYLLAQSLLRQLTTTQDSIDTIFHDINTRRQHIIQQKGLNTHVDYCERGINSDELNGIIQKAEIYTKTAKKTAPEQRSLLKTRRAI